MMPTSDELREVAETLDALSQFALAVLNSKVELITEDGSVLDEKSLATFRDWVSGTEMQDDLRAWADELETKEESKDV